jgi:hypothetical protein
MKEKTSYPEALFRNRQTVEYAMHSITHSCMAMYRRTPESTPSCVPLHRDDVSSCSLHNHDILKLTTLEPPSRGPRRRNEML